MQNPRLNRSRTPTRQPRQGYGQGWPRRHRHRSEGARFADPLQLVSPETNDGDGDGDDHSAIELRSASDRVEITTQLPDCSRDDVRVSVAGAKLRLRAEPSTEEGERIDRTILLATPVRDGDVEVTYDDPTLTVAVHEPERR